MTTTTTATGWPTTRICEEPTLLRPDDYLTDVRALDFDALAAAGVRALLVDIDNTLLPRGADAVPPEYAGWLDAAAAAGFGVCFVSNSWRGLVRQRAVELGYPLVARALKPLPFGFIAGARRLGVRARECAVVGDQIFTDVLGGTLAGARTVLVLPLSQVDLPHTLLLRRVERLIMAGRTPRSGHSGGATPCA